jgi:hypothetical protein
MLVLMWLFVVKPIMKSANTPPPPPHAAEPIVVPSGISPEDTLEGARALYKKRDYRRAASEAQLALTVWERQNADPKDIQEARYLISHAYEKAGDLDQSLAMYDRLIKADPSNAVMRQERGQLLARIQKAGRQKAEATLAQARQQFAAHDDARAVATAQAAMILGNQSGSGNAFMARCNSLVGRALYRQGNYNGARVALQQALRLNPSDGDARRTLAEAKRQIELAQERLRDQYDSQSQPTRTQSTSTSGSYPTASYPQANSTRDDDNRQLPPPRRNHYNPDYSVPGTKYTPRETGMPDLPSGGDNSGSLPTYGDQNSDGKLPNYNSGSGDNTLPTYNNNGGGVYPGYQSTGGNKSSKPPGY